MDRFQKTLEKNQKQEWISYVFDNAIPIKIRQYLPIKKKKVIVEIVSDICFVQNQNHIKLYDYCNNIAVFDYLIIANYTDIDIETNGTEDQYDTFDIYDKLQLIGLKDFVYKNIPKSEIQFLKRAINSRIREVKRSQSINNNNLKEYIQELIVSLENASNETVQTIVDFKPLEQLKMLTSFLTEEQKEKLEQLSQR